MTILVQTAAFDAGDELNKFTAAAGNAGAIVSFTGVTRNTPAGDLAKMVIEHYPGMTERALGDINDRAVARWELSHSLIIHRYGDLLPGDPIMMVATASRHRQNAFEAAEYLMDYLKSRAPFWKQEFTTSGQSWVESKSHDEDALARWSPETPLAR